MPKLNDRLPKYRLHRRSRQAIVTLNGRDHYLGPHGSDASRAEYDRLIAHWLRCGRRLASAADHQAAAHQAAEQAGTEYPATSNTVNHIIHAFWKNAQVHYRRPDGTLTSEIDNFRQALRPLRRLYGQTDARQFGPKALKAVREQMIGQGWCRSNINRQISRVKSVFRWAAENELVFPSIFHGLLAVKGLQRGRTNAVESKPVRPVPEDQIAAVKPFVSQQVCALIQLQLLTGARAGELVRLRAVDLKTADPIWTAEPEDHKTAHHGHTKRIYFGPQAKAILQDFIRNRPCDAFLFSLSEAEALRREKLRASRRTSLSCGNGPGTNRRPSPRRKPGSCYTVTSYRQAIWRACDQAFPPPDELARIKIKSKSG